MRGAAVSRTPRKRLRPPVADFVAIASRRRCCFCYAHDGDFGRKAGQLAHIDHDRTNDSASNLAYLCLPHHNDYDSGTSQAKGLTPGELRAYKRALEDEVVRRLPKIEPPDTSERPLRPRDSDEEKYQRDLLAVGVGFILPADSTALLRALVTCGAGPEVERMVEHGRFTDQRREMLILPPNAELLELFETALVAVSRKRGPAGSAARDMREEVASYRLAISGESSRTKTK